uniref:Rab-GAP TBC domain-containing protein n=1 Tax=Panagrolaimus sp. JU765 TaxID=591449 RepID=A0AC34RMS9_9BILA
MQRHREAVRRGDYQAVVFLLNEVFGEVNRSDTSFLPPGCTASIFLDGILTIVEKSDGVFVEWNPETAVRTSLTPSEDANPAADDSWVIEGSPPKPAVKETDKLQSPSQFAFSADLKDLRTDLKDLRSYTYNEPRHGTTWIRFICKDGTSSPTLHFRGGGYKPFVDCLQRYTVLSRSAKEKNLVLFVDQSTEALEKSVGMLNLNKDIMSRFLSNPYATSLTTLSKITNLMAPLLDSDNFENQVRAMSIMDSKKNDALRSHNDQEGFEHVFELELPDRPVIQHRDAPVGLTVWDSFRDLEGRITDVHSLKSLIFRGGIEYEARKNAWKYILGYYDWDKTDAENKKLRQSKSDSYFRMKLQWMSMSEEQEKNFSDFRDRKALIEKDVTRTDRTLPYFRQKQNLVLLKDILMTYVMYDFDLGYVQGMSDFLSPLLVVLEDEVDAFWCFVGLMNRVHRNFEMDQLAIKQQLSNLKSLLEIVNPRFANYLESHDSDHMYFCFRWILVAFKREFSFDDIMHLWEILWTDIPCKNFLLLFCVAILDGQMNMIIENKFGLTEILKHINNLSMKINLDETLRTAEAIYHQLAAVQDKLPRHICEILSFSTCSLVIFAIDLIKKCGFVVLFERILFINANMASESALSAFVYPLFVVLIEGIFKSVNYHNQFKMSTAHDRAVLNMILNPLMPNAPFEENDNSETDPDPFENLPNIAECRELEKQGIEAAEKNDLDSSISLFTKAIETCPGNPSPFNNRAQTYRLQNKLEEALADLNKSIELSGGKGKAARQAFTQRAMIHLLSENREESRNDFQKAADLGSNFAKMQLVALNPYAAMCNKMLSEVMTKFQRGEQ